MDWFGWSVLVGFGFTLLSRPQMVRWERRQEAREGLARLALERGKLVS